MGGGIEHLVLAGPVLLAIPVAAAAGAVTFLSPCCLPLVPGYLAYLTGMSGTAAAGARRPADEAATALATAGAASVSRPATGGGAGTGVVVGPALTTSDVASRGSAAAAGASQPTAARSRVVFGTLLFILGFSVVFVLEGLGFATVGDALHAHAQGLTQILGGVVILLGLLFLGAFDRFSFAGRIVKPSLRPRAGLVGAPLLGVVFGLGWTPCIGPTLAAVITLGLTSGTAVRGGLLAFVYALGLGVPFLIVAFAFQRGASVLGFARRHSRLITRIGGVMLILVGILEVSGAWQAAISWLQVHWLNGYNAPL